MRRIGLITAILLITGSLGSCLTSSPLPGAIFTNVYTNDHSNHGATISSVPLEKTGESCEYSFLLHAYLIGAAGGATIEEAMQNGGITKIGAIDHHGFNVIGALYYKDCIVVSGQ